uniref:RxLR effector candidate protein n=1 Tax=Hyaloperonospora arabidopsidis (strain Emoy2) TaxID=559515 RepID=M4BII9_HYAAE
MTGRTGLFIVLFALVVLYPRTAADDWVPPEPTAAIEVNFTNASVPEVVTEAPATLAPMTEVTLPPIPTAVPASPTFQAVNDIVCNATVAQKIYVLYSRNRALFDLCVVDAQYHIFPFLGKKPTSEQVANMASSMSCIALFSGVLLANFPECTISGFPLKASTETLLKIHVDLVHGWEPPPTAERFLELVIWRKCVNLAKEAGVPSDSEAAICGEFEKNLDIIRSDSPVRVLSNYLIEYQLSNGSWYGAHEINYTQVGDMRQGSRDDIVGRVSAGDSELEVGDSEATDVRKESTIPVSSALGSEARGIVSTLASLLLGVYLVRRR